MPPRRAAGLRHRWGTDPFTGRFTSTLFVLDVEGEKIRVIPREVQLDPVTDRPIHADFQRLVAGSRIRLFIPVHFFNHTESPGLKRGGVLNIVRHEIEFFLPTENIPQFIEVDLAGMDIGDSLHISKVKLPEGLVPVIRNRDFTVATVAAPSAFADAEAKTATADGAAAPAAGAAPAAAAAPAAGAKAAAPAAGAKAAPAAKAPAKK
jgi:large subunit ribosomal protein L25